MFEHGKKLSTVSYAAVRFGCCFLHASVGIVGREVYLIYSGINKQIARYTEEQGELDIPNHS